MALATGDFLIIQDADLEYDPQDYVPMMQALLAGRGDVVYGSRYLGRGRHTNQSLTAYLGGRSLSYVALACTGTYLTDTVTALKLFPARDADVSDARRRAASSSITRSPPRSALGACGSSKCRSATIRGPARRERRSG